MRSKVGWLVRTSRDLAVIALVTMLLSETALRAFPDVISLSLLYNFNSELREDIAARRQLPTQRSRAMLERSDGGPPLWLWKPDVEVKRNYRDEGSVPVVRMDERGFCNVRSVYSNSAAFEILTIGDSFTWCEGVDPQQAWPFLLGQSLDRSVYNLGMPGVGPYEYLQILEAYGLQKSPGVVVLNIFEGNDLGSLAAFQSYARAGGDTDSRNSDSIRATYSRIRDSALVRNSLVLSLILSAARNAYVSVTAAPALSFRYSITGTDEVIDFNMENTDLEDVEYARALNDGEISARLFTDPLRRFKALSEEYGFQPVVMFSPAAHTVYRRLTTFDDPAVGRTMYAYSDAVRTAVRSICAEEELLFLDLTEPLVEKIAPVASDRLLYFRYNLHYTQRGHFEVAAILSDYLAQIAAE